MVNEKTMRQLALQLEGAEEIPHFEKISFRVKNKIFATLDVKAARACLKLSAVDQSVFSAADKAIIYPVPNAWGRQGWTFVELNQVRKDLFTDALNCAYGEVTKKKTKEKK